ncbi:SMI1/KNR4 family protein [Actinomadura luteofluorescens]|uniref:SMI1/KNR4 family protein n=1 Tax=Actinomadura luteofluorescens TaxID=46163 RepID=UPI0034834841
MGESEALLGRSLPSLLRACCLELGDGGFGPAYGLGPLQVILRDYEEQQQSWPEAWQPMARALLPICNWGCGIASYIDLTDPSIRMWAIDPNPAPAGHYEVSLFRNTSASASGWAGGSRARFTSHGYSKIRRPADGGARLMPRPAQPWKPSRKR